MLDEPRRPSVSLVAIEGTDFDPAFRGEIARLVDGTLQYVKDGGCVNVEVHYSDEARVKLLEAANNSLERENGELAAALTQARQRIAELEAGQPPTPPQPKAMRARIGLKVRDQAGHATGQVIPAGETVRVYEMIAHLAEVGTTNTWDDRAVIDPPGVTPRRNVWAGADAGGPVLQEIAGPNP